MEKDKEQVSNNHSTKIKPTFNLEPVKNLEGINLEDSNAFMCDIETGICGPVDPEEEKKQ